MTHKGWACTPRGEYPDNWKDISYQAKDAAGWVCEHCGMLFWPISGKAKTAVNDDGKPVILTVHHLDGDKANCSHANLLVCCQICHLHIQAVWSPGMEIPAAWVDPPAWLIERGLAFKPTRQINFLHMVG